MKYAAELLHRPDADGTDATRSRLLRHLVGNMQSGHMALLAAARHLGMTTRTLQRRLREEGTSFNAVLDEVRRDVALTQMRERRQSIDELAFALGFEKTSSFHRAFKRWTGLTLERCPHQALEQSPQALDDQIGVDGAPGWVLSADCQQLPVQLGGAHGRVAKLVGLLPHLGG